MAWRDAVDGAGEGEGEGERGRELLGESRKWEAWEAWEAAMTTDTTGIMTLHCSPWPCAYDTDTDRHR